MSNPKKTKVPVFDGLMSTHWGVCQQADALFGIKVKDKLCWPPAQVDGDDTVERAPQYDAAKWSAVDDLNTMVVNLGTQTGLAPVVGPQNPQIMTAERDEYIHEPDLFGGDTNGTGGVEGVFTWLPGKADQILPTSMTSRFGISADRCPSFRGLATAFFCGGRRPTTRKDSNGIDMGGLVNPHLTKARTSNNQGFKWGTNDPYVPSATMRVFRAPYAPPLRDFAKYALNPYNVQHLKQMMTRVIAVPRAPARNKSDGDGKLPQGGGFPAANPAAVIYELLSSARYDMNSTEAALDAASFLICARLLSVEKAGISFAWVDQDSVKAIIEEICAHIQGAVFVHPKTGLYTMRLLRPDAAFSALGMGNEIITLPWKAGFKLSPSNARLADDIERKTWSDVINWVSVKFTDDETSKEKSVSVQAPDLIAAAGGRVNDATLNYWMFRSEETAIAAGERELSAASRPLMKASWIVNRTGWSIAPYDVITVDWPSEGIVKTRFRVLAVDYGDGKNRDIRIDAVEDVFSEKPRRTAIMPQAALWTPPPKPTIRQPYMTPASAPMLMRNGLSRDELDLLDQDGDAVMIHMISSDANLTGADAFVRSNAEDLPQTGVAIESVPRALLNEPLGVEATSTISFYDMDFGAQERDPEPGDLLVFVRPRTDKPSLDRFWTTISGGRLLPTGLPQAGYGSNFAPSKLHWGVGTAAMALDEDSARIATMNGLAPAYHEEVCQILTVDRDTGDTVIRRGIYDTVPAPLPAGCWVFHLSGQPPVPRETSADGEYMLAAYRPKSASAVARSTTPQYPFVATARQEMPARPGNVRITVGPETWAFGSKAVLDEPAPVQVRWATRNRITDDAQPASWTAGNITPESGQRHYVRVWRRVCRNATGDSPAVLVDQFYDLAGDSYVIPAAVFSNSLNDPDWNPGEVVSDIPAGGAFVIEVGAQRTEPGRVLVATPENPLTDPAQMSAQAALMLIDVGTEPSGWGKSWGKDWGG
ncbi:phage tail protein [Paracoccus sanguinis]|uniref:Tip attachment protein J domain-containing protein n=1 Tax=Paracoccus sanguinis TaxID=1545044 RepID=A0A099GLN6_9RHOB|nr:phage tail protein [Paracoccus sanguinis]KGJ23754.1 hypothetical protein IX56_00310 [Paracoccus sanguinis]